jgi:hypothetical protein
MKSEISSAIPLHTHPSSLEVTSEDSPRAPRRTQVSDLKSADVDSQSDVPRGRIALVGSTQVSGETTSTPQFAVPVGARLGLPAGAHARPTMAAGRRQRRGVPRG